MALGDAVHPHGRQASRVVLDAYGFIKGWMIATSLWVGVLLLVVGTYFGIPAARTGLEASQLLGILGMAIFYGYGVSLLFAAPLGWFLSFLLRPVGRQSIHIGAFFAVPTIAFWLVGNALGLGWKPWHLIPWSTVGAAAAAGRWAVRNDVLYVDPDGARQ